MKFSKLKVYIGVILVIILIVSTNIMILGAMEKKILADIEKRPCPLIIREVVNNYTIINQSGASTGSSTSTTNPSANNNPPVQSNTPVTRAS